MHEGYALSVEGEIRAVNDAWCQILEVIGFVTTLRDVSDRNRRQRELERPPAPTA